MFYNGSRFFPKHAEPLMRIKKNNSVVMTKQPAETPAREDEKQRKLIVLCKNH